MNIIITCGGCGQELLVDDSRTRLTNEIIITVSACSCNRGESDCSECEDLPHLNKKIIELQQKLETANEKLQTIKDFFIGEKSDQPKKENLPTAEDTIVEPEPVEFQTHATKPTEEKPEVNILHPTSDIESTGGAIVPGIKQGSAKDAKADYRKGVTS